MPQSRTLCELFQASLAEQPRPAAFLHKVNGKYQPVSSAAFASRVAALSTGLRALGLQPGERVAILAENCLEWALADYAILHARAVTVPIYPSLQGAAVQALLAQSGAVAVFAADPAQLAKVSGAGVPTEVRDVILLGGEAPPATSRPRVHVLRDVEARGEAAFDAAEYERTWRGWQPDELATLIFTSGTSGAPKGVPLTHANIVSNIEAMLRRVQIHPHDITLTILPLSHVLQRTCGHFLMWHVGATIAYAVNIDSVAENLLEVHPTVLISVPRIYEKMNARMRAAVEQAPAFRRALFVWSMNAGRARVQREQAGRPVPLGLRLRCRIADRLVFARLRERMGKHMRLMISGGAPLSRSISEFFAAAGLPILEGYGLTETSPVLCLAAIDRAKIGSVGPALDNLELRIGAEGEILARGPSVMAEYWHNPEATAAAFDQGWFRTGDVGELDADQYLHITDRLKDLIVTAGGKKVAPQPIEARLKTFQHLAEALLVGDQRKFVSALVVPNFQHLERWAHAHGLTWHTRAELVRAPRVLHLYADYFTHINEELAPFERVKRFRVLERELEATAGELTPTLKARRRAIAATCAGLIETMYAEPPGPEIGVPAA
jgi:long-chain acyl-CoA synthetase